MSGNPNPTVCGNCGTKNPPKSEVCVQCGQPLVAMDSTDESLRAGMGQRHDEAELAREQDEGPSRDASTLRPGG